MKQSDDPRCRKLSFWEEHARFPHLRFGTPIPDEARPETQPGRCCKRISPLGLPGTVPNEEQVGVAIRDAIQASVVTCGNLFITMKLWNNNHRPERVRPAFESSP